MGTSTRQFQPLEMVPILLFHYDRRSRGQAPRALGGTLGLEALPAAEQSIADRGGRH
jgi:hypothetical protein